MRNLIAPFTAQNVTTILADKAVLVPLTRRLVFFAWLVRRVTFFTLWVRLRSTPCSATATTSSLLLRNDTSTTHWPLNLFFWWLVLRVLLWFVIIFTFRLDYTFTTLRLLGLGSWFLAANSLHSSLLTCRYVRLSTNCLIRLRATAAVVFALIFHFGIFFDWLFFLFRIAALEVFDVIDISGLSTPLSVWNFLSLYFRSLPSFINRSFILLFHFLLLAYDELLIDPFKDPQDNVERI